MKASRIPLFILVLTGTSFLVVTSSTAAAITAYGQVTDPVGDSLDSSVDLVFGSISITCTHDAIFRIRYAPSYDATTASGFFTLDIDKNPSTGDLWFGMGVEAVVATYGTGFQGTAYYQLFTPYMGPAVSIPATYLSDGVEVEVPLSILGSSDGLMNFHVCSSVQLEDYVWTSIRDWMPALGSDFKVGVAVVSPVASCIPAPGAILLGTIGAGLVGWLRRRRTL